MENTGLSDNATLAIHQHYSADAYPAARYHKTRKASSKLTEQTMFKTLPKPTPRTPTFKGSGNYRRLSDERLLDYFKPHR
jgi:hypothetical protein